MPSSDHRIADDAQREGFTTAQQVFGEQDGFGGFQGLDGPAGGDAAQQGNRRDATVLPVDDFDRPAMVRTAPDEPAAFETLQMLVHGRQRRHAQMAADLDDGWGVAEPAEVRLDEVDAPPSAGA